MYKALCIATRQAVIIKSYEKAKMKQKNFLRMEREIKLMNMLGEAQAAWQQLMAAKICRPRLRGCAALQAAGVQAQPSDVGCSSLRGFATALDTSLSALEAPLQCNSAFSMLLLLPATLSGAWRAQHPGCIQIRECCRLKPQQPA